MSALPRAARLYLIAMWSITTIVVGMVVFFSPNMLAQIPLLGLGLAIYVFADYYEIEFEAGDGNQALMTVTDAVVIYLVAVVGHAGIFVVALGTFIVSRMHHTVWFRNLFNISSRTLTFVALFLAYDAIQLPGTLPFSGFRGLVEFVALASIDYVASVLFVSTVIALARQQPLLHIYRESFRQVSWVYLVTLPVGAVLAFLWQVDPWLSLLGVIPLVMAHRSYKALAAWQMESRRNKALALESRQLAGKLERLQDTTTAMIASLDPLPLLQTVSSRLAALMDASASWVVLLDSPTPRMVAVNNIAVDFFWDAKAYLVEFRQRTVQQLGPAEIVRLHGRDHSWQTLVIIPLLLEQQVLGGICLASEHPIALAEDDRRVLAAFAGQAALAMERARLFAELRDKQAELIRSSKLAALGTFSAGIAHEFNNLLAGILGYAELGLMSDDVAEKDDALNVAVRTSMRGKSITRGLLTFARRNDPERDLHQIRDAIEDTLILVERELVKLNIRVVRRFEPVPMTTCDLGQVSQVVLNLITNARDAMAENGGGTITIELYQNGQQIEFAVSDTGCGIAPDLLDQVFQPFVTTKGALGGSTTPGTGLGLAISYGIVESHGGTIAVSSEVGRGTTMKVRLPIIDEMTNLTETNANTKPHGPMRILIVDDEQMVVEALGRLLAEHGHAVSTACDAHTGLKLYRQQPFDLVITDVIMPGMSGATFVERLRAFDSAARVLVITGQPGAPQLDQLLRAGACGVVTKPFVVEELLSAIEHGHYAQALAA